MNERDAEFINQTLFTADNGEQLMIVDIRGTESELDHLEITVANKDKTLVHEIRTKEL